jgi:oxygen-independent coproporphyrinogen III oxidase
MWRAMCRATPPIRPRRISPLRWSGAISAAWLEEVAADAAISLYLHVPFCRAICHYCGCHTKAARRDEPISAYAALLRRELDLVLRHLGTGRKLVHVHWGGGTPSILPESDFLALVDQIYAGFDCSPDLEHAIELDPRTITPELADPEGRRRQPRQPRHAGLQPGGATRHRPLAAL